MLVLSNTSPSVLIAIGIAVMILATTVFILFHHDRKHQELDQWVDFSFSRDSLRHALGYYRFMAVSMLIFYVLFTCSSLLLQAEGYQIFSDGQQPVKAGPIATSLFALDLVLRGGFFDFMQHFDLHVTGLNMNRNAGWFVWYAFVFRMFYGLTMFKILFSFVWVYGKIRLARQAQRQANVRLPFSS